MAKKKCFQFIVKDRVQDVGLRLTIARLIPDELEVRTDNLPEGSVRVVVRGYKQDVMKFWKALQQQVLGKAENPTFPGPAQLTTTSIDTDRFFHKLQCEQMEKFVDVGLDMKKSIDCMTLTMASMDSKLEKLPKNMAMEIVKLKKNGFF